MFYYVGMAALLSGLRSKLKSYLKAGYTSVY